MSELFDPKTRVELALELHEALAIAVLYDEAPDDLEMENDGIWYGESLDSALLKIAGALARILGDKELLLRSGAIRAQFDQEQAA